MAGHHHDGQIGLDRTPPNPASRHAGARAQKGIGVAAGGALRRWNRRGCLWRGFWLRGEPVLAWLGRRGGAQQQRQRQPTEAEMFAAPLPMTACVPGHASDQIGDDSREPSLES